jgi:hypothetical protein
MIRKSSVANSTGIDDNWLNKKLVRFAIQSVAGY